MTTWYDRVGHGLAYAPALAAVVALLAGARAWYRRTLGRRSDKYERIARLGTNAHLTFFTSVLGEPPAMHRSLTSMVSVLPEDSDELVLEERAFLESVIDRDFYVHTFSDHDLAWLESPQLIAKPGEEVHLERDAALMKDVAVREWRGRSQGYSWNSLVPGHRVRNGLFRRSGRSS